MPGTRERLLAVAAELVAEGGPAAVTLREVGARAGVSHNTPYRHFADKRDLLAAVAAAALRDLAARVEAAGDSGGAGSDRVRRAALAYLAWAGERPALFKLVFGTWGPEPHDELGEAAATAMDAMRGCVGAAVTAGELVGDPDRIAMLIWAMSHGVVDLGLAGHLRKHAGSPTAEELVEELLGRLAA